MKDNEFELLPPPRVEPLGELWPVIEPPFRDQAPPDWNQEFDEWERIESTEIEDEPVLTDELAREAEEAALADDDVRESLGERYVSIGVTLDREKDAQLESSQLRAVFYAYGDDVTVEVLLDYEDVAVREIREGDYQPAPVTDEVERAIDLAREDDWLAERLDGHLEGRAILLSTGRPDDPHQGRRVLDVRFAHPQERLPRYVAIVNLSEETVLETGAVDRDRCRGQGERHG